MRIWTRQTRLEVLLILRRPEAILIALVIPAGLLVFFSIVPEASAFDAGVSQLLPGVASIAVIATAMVGLGVSTGYERHYQVLKRLGATPLGRGRLIAAKSTAVLFVEVIQLAVLVIAAILVGWDPQGSAVRVVIIWILGTASFAGLGLLLAGNLRAEANLAVLNFLFLLFLLMGGALFPLSSLPEGTVAVAETFPATPLAEGFRWAFGNGTPFPWDLLGWAGATPLLAALRFRWE